MMGESYLILNGSILLLFISICLHHRAFYKRFENSMHRFNSSVHEKRANEILCEVIDFHNCIKSWFFESSAVFSLYILIQLICSAVFLACTMFQIDLQVKHFDYSMVVHLMGLMVSMANLFFYCYFGKAATESYEQMAVCLYDSNWFDHSVYLQKYFILMIGNMHRPLYYHGFGIAVLDLDTFTSLLRKAVTFYMLFKTITSR